ncbi:winged helix-turn-helix transcriptional regulator [Limoniibacter endophyticus]|uniref:Transcriptional regulator n=1 Tax=Limoniibacter endophyticus TaxID=1565040 RepID=A0A8J3GHA9_9HYPH|nr:helix-turn-helix domain-containing protein [Limoniibacter endophyticus]GHC70335.1 transcriptional regulator [Limoniibacter endophyticus]
MKLEKITEEKSGPSKRRYDDACAAAHALDLLGERWSLLVVRELMTGAKRFSDLRAALPGISANVLTQRLDGLEETGILVRRKLAKPASVQVYELTAWGYQTEPIFQALGRWAARSPFHDPTAPFSNASLLLSLRTMFSSESAKGFSARINLHLDDENYRLDVSPPGVEFSHGSYEEVDFSAIGSARAVAGWIYGGLDPADPASGLTIEGDMLAAEKFVGFFPLPAKA